MAIDRFPDDVPEEVKKVRNNELLALQAEIGAAVHADWVGRDVEVLVERITDRQSPEARSEADSRVTLGVGLSSSQASTNTAAASVQVSGRTPGDLITVFEVGSRESAEALLGTIVRVRIESSGPLILRGVACFEDFR